MSKRYHIAFLLLFISYVYSLPAQSVSRYNSFKYNVNEGLLQSTLADMSLDNNNFCWLSFPNGIQKFDGKNFINVPIQPGLPDNKMTRFYRRPNGDLLIGHTLGISWYDVAKDKFVLVYTNPKIDRTISFIGEDENIIYFLVQTMLVGLDTRNYKVVKEVQHILPDSFSVTDYRPRVSENIINHRAVVMNYPRLLLLDLKQGKIIKQSKPIPDLSFFFLKMKSDTEVLYFARNINNGFGVFNFATSNAGSILLQGKDNIDVGRGGVFAWRKKHFAFFNNRIFEIDSGLTKLGTEIVNFQNDPVSGNANIWHIQQDNIGNLYAATVTSGIVRISGNNYQVRYFGSSIPSTHNVLSVFADKARNRVLTGTYDGLLVFDTLQHLIKHISKFPGKEGPQYVSTILKANNEGYILFSASGSNHWMLSADLSTLTPIRYTTNVKNPGVQYFCMPLYSDPNYAIVQSQGRLYKNNIRAKKFEEYEFTTSYTMGGLLFNNKIITHANDELIFLDVNSFHDIKRVPFKNTGYVRCFQKGPDQSILMGTNNGIFKIDSNGNILSHLTKKNGLPDDCVYAIALDRTGSLWCSTNKGIFKLNDNKIVQLKKEDGLQENEFNTNVMFQSDDGELFFGGVNGVSSFYPEAISKFDEKVKIIFTGIKANNEEALGDEAPWNITKLTLPYNKNSLSFDFIAIGNNTPGQYLYQYQMEGIDKNWIQNEGTQTVRYSLPPGHYTFKVYASRFFDNEATSLKEIRITIKPPVWKTWWFLASLGIIVMSFFLYVANLRVKRKYEKKLQALESEQKIKLERERISRDLHDSLGAYANAVLYNTELLEKESPDEKRKELIDGLKFASKDIITSLRETVWALKKESFTAEDCLLRIRNFIQPFTRYYSHIQFRVEGEAPGFIELHSTRALNVVRIVQEAVSNSIKHSMPSTITISNHLLPQKKWKLVITDNGSGFDYKAASSAEHGNGLTNMQHRATESGFELTIQSSQSGTITTIIV